MFLLNSCVSLFSAARSLWHPFSRSYGVILPSSLTMLLPPALGFSPHPPVSVYGTGTLQTIAAFLGSVGSGTSLLIFRSASRIIYYQGFFLPITTPRLHQEFQTWLVLSLCVPTVLLLCSTGISTCYPSTTLFSLALGPDLPREDQLYSGNLGYSAYRILTYISLLIPAFSLHNTPRLLSVPLRRVRNAPLPLM